MKRLIVCCDGTWNTPDQLSSGRPSPTHVTRLALAIAPTDSSGVEQRMFYHRGVGTTRWERIRGGAFGLGLSRNVRDCYRFLVANFEPGDEIFLFGFSRGAFTARSTAGFIRNSGILRPEHADHVGEAYNLYRSRQAHPRGVEATLFRRTYSHETRIRCIGVWDTVGALGVPINGLRLLNVLNRRNEFHDTDLSTTVDAAFQALAIDESRKPFRPAIWNKQPSSTPQEVEQVWFAGCHCDVGGGYADHTIADIPLRWMIKNAMRQGLAIDEAAFLAGPFAGQPHEDPAAPAPDPLGKTHESRTSFYRLLRPYHRPLDADPVHRESVASSVLERTTQVPGYAPQNLIRYLAEPAHQVTTVDD
jgi:uncharacterized protein (DUF2235 family)